MKYTLQKSRVITRVQSVGTQQGVTIKRNNNKNSDIKMRSSRLGSTHYSTITNDAIQNILWYRIILQQQL